MTFELQEEATNKQKERDWERRQQRKRREAFQLFLEELHDSGKLLSTSLWKVLYPVISQDQRYVDMLGQTGGCGLYFKYTVTKIQSTHNQVT